MSMQICSNDSDKSTQKTKLQHNERWTKIPGGLLTAQRGHGY